MNNHGHQTRNKYILLCCLKYLFSSVPSSLISTTTSSTNQYTRVGVLHNIPHSTTTASINLQHIDSQQPHQLPSISHIKLQKISKSTPPFLHSNSSAVLAKDTGNPLSNRSIDTHPRTNQQPPSLKTYFLTTTSFNQSDNNFGLSARLLSNQIPFGIRISFLVSTNHHPSQPIFVTELV